MELQQAVESLKSASRLFQAFKDVGDAAETVLAVSSHEVELRASVARLLDEAQALETRVSDARAAEAQRTADAKANGDRTIRGYEAKIEAIGNELTKAKADRQVRIDIETQTAERIVVQIRAAFERDKSRIESEHHALLAEHEAFVTRTQETRAQIEAQTAALREELDGLRQKAKSAFDAVKE